MFVTDRVSWRQVHACLPTSSDIGSIGKSWSVSVRIFQERMPTALFGCARCWYRQETYLRRRERQSGMQWRFRRTISVHEQIRRKSMREFFFSILDNSRFISDILTECSAHEYSYEISRLARNFRLQLLAGITSFGVPNCGDKHPTVFTRVSTYHDWVLANPAGKVLPGWGFIAVLLLCCISLDSMNLYF